MRTLAQASSALQQPLDLIIGTPAAVRILRVLAAHGGALPPTVIADQARINRSGAGRTLGHLSETEIVAVVGIGRYVSYQLNQQHPFTNTLQALFDAERARLAAIHDGIRRLTLDLNPGPVAVWIFGSGARGEDLATSDLDIAVVGEDEGVHAMADALRDALQPLAERLVFRPSVISLTRADVRAMKRDETAFWQNIDADAVSLVGGDPMQVARG